MNDCYEKKSFSEHFRGLNASLLIADEENRKIKARKIFSVIEDFIGDPEAVKRARCLDLGSSEGHISNFMAQYFGKVIGVDTDQPAIETAAGRSKEDKAVFVCGSGLDAPFRDHSFDVVICNQIYEHVPDPDKMMEQIGRILKKDGICFFGAGNRFKIMEGHYFLPFLSWLPKPLADRYLRIAGKGTSYEERHFSYYGIRKLVRNFKVSDYTLRIVREPDKFSFVDAPKMMKWISRLPAWLLTLLLPLAPNYMYILSNYKNGRNVGGSADAP